MARALPRPLAEERLDECELGTHVDNERLQNELKSMFAAIKAIGATDIADLVQYVVTRPAYVNLRHVVIVPTQQA